MGRPPSDEELAQQAQGGCSASFDELVRRFQVPLLHFLRRRAPEDAEDLTQDTFVRAYQNIRRYRPAYRFSTWLFTIGRRLSMNHRRRKRPTADSPVIESAQADGPEPGQQVAEEETRLLLWDLADEVLTERQMTTMSMYYVREMPIEEIAHVVGGRRGAVKTMLFRARKKLFAVMQAKRSDDSANPSAEKPATSSQKTTVEYTNG